MSNELTGFRPVDWAPSCLLSLAPYKISRILRTTKIEQAVACIIKLSNKEKLN